MEGISKERNGAANGERGVVERITETLGKIGSMLNCVLLGILIAGLVVSYTGRDAEKDGEAERQGSE